MHQNQSGIYTTNNLSSHASLLLSASPTIITSPLQNNTNNPQSSPLSSQTTPTRRQPSAQLLAASNFDNNDSHSNTNSPSISTIDDGYINFKKPQNEMFKKLDGKIQRIVAAHSNLNKLYALNDFPSLGVGPKRPFELPPQLPPPPPWVPRVSAEYGNQWNEDSINPLSSLDDRCNSDADRLRRKPSIPITNTPIEPVKSCSTATASSSSKAGTLTIDSAITKLHKRHQEQQLNQKSPVNQVVSGPTSSSSHDPPSNLSAAALSSLLRQKIREALMTQRTTKYPEGTLSDEDKINFQRDVINLLKQSIERVSKGAKLKFNIDKCSPPRPKVPEQRSLLLKGSPQTLFNTIRRETSLLLSKAEQLSARPSLSLLSDQQNFNRHLHENITVTSVQSNHKPQTIKVVAPPTEYFCSISGFHNSHRCQVGSSSNSLQKTPKLSYQVIKSKVKSFQELNQICLGKTERLQDLRKKSLEKSLEKIVDRLYTTKCSPCPPGPTQAPIAQKLTNLATSILKSSRRHPSTIQGPTPIPVFRTHLPAAAKSGYLYPSSAGASRIVNLESKKSKRSHSFGLRLVNYLERECPQPTTDEITIEQFARCLNLVRSNDVSLQRHQEQLMQAQSKWRLPISNRPLRLRRLRGERVHMPASASYRATRKAGLQ